MRLILPLALLLTLTAARGASPGEDVFEAAKRWTVQVRVSVERPFIEDEQGSLGGAGLVVDATRGWILTNAHVATHSYAEVSIVFRGARALPAGRIYVDPYLDLAVLAYDTRALSAPPPEPQLECDSVPAVGHPVGAFGHPWGFRFTGTRGIASAVTTRLGPAMLQTDAPVNHGNSGGPLISLESGRVVGINTATINKEDAEGLSFAVPMPYACTILALLRQGLDPSPPANLVDFAGDEDGEQTLMVARSRLPTGSLELQPGDTILAVGLSGGELDSETDLVDALRGHMDDVILRISRNGTGTTVRGRWPAAPQIIERHGLWISGALFADAEGITTGHIAGEPRLMVHHVEPGSPAEAARFSATDLLVSADDRPVTSLAELERLARRAAAEERELSLMFLRLYSDERDRFFVYESRSLDATDVQPVGPVVAAAVDR
jgi:S1-C subfamily serine protease